MDTRAAFPNGKNADDIDPKIPPGCNVTKR
jgi:hypothetical protein